MAREELSEKEPLFEQRLEGSEGGATWLQRGEDSRWREQPGQCKDPEV